MDSLLYLIKMTWGWWDYYDVCSIIRTGCTSNPSSLTVEALFLR